MPDAVIRRAVAGDLATILTLYRSLHATEPPGDPDRTAAAWAALMASDWTIVFMAEIAGAAAASCVLAIVPNLTRDARPFGVIENVVTSPDHRRLGLGRSVLQAAVQTAWERDCYKVMLATGRPETAPFYQSVGFGRGGKTAFEMRRP